MGDVDFFKTKVPINKIHFGKNFDYESDIGKELLKFVKTEKFLIANTGNSKIENSICTIQTNQ